MTPVDILRSARELISVPEKWTQGANARTTGGVPIEYDHPRAICFCLYGAICRVAGVGPAGPAWEYLHQLVSEGGQQSSVSEFNDYAAHSDVLTLLDDAIALAEQEPSK